MKSLTTSILVAISIVIFSCNNTGSYQTSANGLQYQIIQDAKNTKAQKGEYIVYNTTWRTNSGEIIFSTNNSTPVSGIVPDSLKYQGDPNEILRMLGKGDSASLLVNADKFFSGIKLPKNINKGDNVRLDIKVVDVMPASAYEQYMSANKPEDPEMKAIKEYIAQKGWVAEQLPSGLFIVTDDKGKGSPLANGMKVTMQYSGFL